MTDVVWLIPALPLAGFLVLLVAGRRLGEPGAGWLAKILMERAQTRLLDQALHRAGEVLVEGPGRARPESRGDF